MTDLAETIERLRQLYASGRAGDVNDICRMEREIWKVLPALLDAAERALALDSVGFTPSTPDVERARDAALEEAAKVCDDAASTAPSTEYGGGFTDGVSWAAANIRSRKGAA